MDNEPPACIFKVNEMRDEMEFFGVALIVGVPIGVLIASQNRSSQKYGGPGVWQAISNKIIYVLIWE